MECTHGELSARFADGLRRDNADGLARVDGLADGKVDAVALRADADTRLAREHGADERARHAVRLKDIRVLGHEHMVGVEQHLARLGIGDGLRREAAVDGRAEALDELAAVIHCGRPDALGRAAVGLADDDILAHVDHTAREVTGVGGTQCGIRHALTGTSRGDEILQDGKAFAEVGLDGYFDGLTGGVRHQASHTGELTDLVHGAAGAGVCHHVYGVVLIQNTGERIGDFLGGLFPLGDNEAVALIVGDEAALVLALYLDDLVFGLVDELGLRARDGHIRDGYGDRALGGVLVAHRLDAVEHLGRDGEAVLLDAAVDDIAQLLLADLEADLMVKGVLGVGAVNVAEILGDGLVEDYAADGGDDGLLDLDAVHGLGNSQADRRMQPDAAVVVGHDGLGGIAVHKSGLIGDKLLPVALELLILGIYIVAGDDAAGLIPAVAGIVDNEVFRALLGRADAHHRQIVRAEDHVLRRHGDGVAVLRAEEVVGGEHEDARLCLRFGGKREMDCHLVAVEVGVVRGADQRVQSQRTPLDQHRLERLNA